MGWEKTLVPILSSIINEYPNFNPNNKIKLSPKLLFPKNRREVKQLSPNHHELGLSIELLHAAVYGTEEEYDIAADKYLHLLRLHLYITGLWTSEQFTGSPHAGFYLAAMFAARLAVYIINNQQGERLHESVDRQIVKLLDEYTNRVFNYLMITADDTGEIICCGERMPHGPAAPQQTAIYREVYNLPHINIKTLNKQSRDDYWLSLRILKILISAGDSLAGVRHLKLADCKLPFTSQIIHVDRWKGGHRTYYDVRSKVSKDTCMWTWAHNGNVRWGSGKLDKMIPPVGGEVVYSYRSESFNKIDKE